MHRAYRLHIRVTRPVAVTVGRLGRFTFPAGRYVYTGSARRALDARIARHLSREPRRLHGHIDYLLAAPGCRVTGVERHDADECALNRAVGGLISAPGFGASDCRAGCGSHLRYLGKWGRRGAP
jgi:Uri superfamily endonuclease